MIIIDVPTRRPLPTRTQRPVAVIIHGTGNTDLDAILKFYTDEDGYQPHYLISSTGTVRKIAEEDRIAYHAGTNTIEDMLYVQGWPTWSRIEWVNEKAIRRQQTLVRYELWRKTWREGKYFLQSPLDLVTGGKRNARAIGIELQSSPKQLLDGFEPIQYRSLAEMLRAISVRWSIPLDREHVLGHYDVSPIRRSNAKGSYDPGEKFNWQLLWNTIASGK